VNAIAPRAPRETPFSLDGEMLEAIFRHAKPLGHHEDRERLNLGFGFLYYALARSLRPSHVVIVGSGYGFSVACFALALKDNGAGKVSFVDPSYSLLQHGPLATIGGASHWDDAGRVREHFARFGVEGIVTHYKMTSREFFETYDERGPEAIDLAFIDGNHSFSDVRHDFVATMRHARRGSLILLHDTNIYFRELVRHAGVKRWLRTIRRDPETFDVLDFPLSSGVALVRVLRDGPWHPAV
jgi:predicted O-methyltransferase YrrM